MIIVVDASLNLHRAKNVLLRAAREQPQKQESLLSVRSFVQLFFKMLPVTLDHFDATRCYLLWDEGKCTYRTRINSRYKAARNEVKKDDLDLTAGEIFKQARQELHDSMPKIGIASLLVPGVEADDMAYYLSHSTGPGVLVSDDQDWFLNMNHDWRLYRTMQKENSKFSFVNGHNLFDWNGFTRLMNGDSMGSQSDARQLYLYEKACVGDKDEIPRIATRAPAIRIARYLCGVSDELTAKDQKILDEQKDNIKVNLQLANTDWLIQDPKIVDMPAILEQAHGCVTVGSMENFFEFATGNNCLMYQPKWNKISKLLDYKEIIQT